MKSRRPSENALEDLRLLVYAQLAAIGCVETTEQLAARLDLAPAAAARALRALHDNRDLVLDDDGNILLAHPFATANFGFSVMGASTIWWGGCAWDAFAIAHLVSDEPDTLVATRCPQCRNPHAWNVTRREAPAGSQIVHFATPMGHVWDDVVHACHHQKIFCDTRCLDLHLNDHPTDHPGARFDVPTLWDLARSWYAGRLDRGYRRRDPASAAAYFASVGLTGPFWASGTPHGSS